MAKEYKRQITYCIGCPNAKRLVDGDVRQRINKGTVFFWCSATRRELVGVSYEYHSDNINIPEWCPLAEAETEVL